MNLEEKHTMYAKRLMMVVGVLAALSMALSACGPAATPTEAPAPAPTEAAAPAPAATEAPTEVPQTTRHGGWVDEIDFSVVDSASAITQLKAGAIDIYAGGLASADLPSIKDAGMSYSSSNGLYYDMLYNPSVLKDPNKLNPFSSRKIREATNWLYDRNYINQEVYAGGGLVKFFAIQTNGPDYADLADVARTLEAKYAYNLDKAKEVIYTEMSAMGAVQGGDGKWTFKGSPVTISLLVRTDSDGTRKPIGDYVTKQLEAVGFTVDEQYKKSSEAGPVVWDTDPAEGQWIVYTAAWSSSIVDRDEANIFQEMYLNTSQQGTHPFLDNVADPAFQKVGDDLYNSAFAGLDQRRRMMAEAMALSLEDSLQVFLIDGKQYTPYVNNLQVTADVAAGVESAQMAAHTLRFKDKEGGVVKWGEPDLFAEPWNPIGGSNWTFDHAAYDRTQSGAFISDPFTGLVWPLMAEKADVTVQAGLPVSKTLDWVTLNTADTITVPPDAWIDWDVKNEKWITVGEKFPEGLTAKVKSVTYYRPDLLDKFRWHDGSKFSVADLVGGQIIPFELGNPDSKMYDESYVPIFDGFKAHFKGWKITSTDPVTVEWYDDQYQQDAELDVFPAWPGSTGFQVAWNQGEGPWHVMALGDMAEAAGELAWNGDKADKAGIERTSLIGGPSLEILSKHLDEAIASDLIPFAPTLGQYITADDAKERWNNLKTWYTEHGHFLVGSGPYYLDKVFLTEKTLTLKSFSDYPDLSNRWERFGEPMIADAALDGPAQVKIGEDATFDVAVTFKGNPYPQNDIKKVLYLLYDATGAVVESGQATAVADGQYQVVLSGATTGKLAAGADKIEVAVLPIPVLNPTFTSLDFVTVP
jgi:peptide/nickel transport system substrate-binding protein